MEKEDNLMKRSDRSGQNITQPAGYRAFIPKPLPPKPPLKYTDKMLALLSNADRKIGRLDGLTTVLHNPTLFVSMYVTKEALLSSQIEGTQATLLDVIQIDDLSGRKKLEALKVTNYINALNHGMSRLNDLPLSLRLLKEIHQILLAGVRGENKHPGEFRTTQNWIGSAGCSLNEASFVPPPPHEMMKALADLELFMHTENSIPKLVQIALIHAQFEMIHPFLDGNGRIGRLLIAFWLYNQKILNYPLLYISYYLKKHRIEYYDRLRDVSEFGKWEEWVVFFLEAVASTAESATNCGREIIKLKEGLFAEFQKDRRNKANINDLIDLLFEIPVLKITDIQAKLGTSYPTAKSLVDLFLSRNVLSIADPAQTRNKSYVFDAYLALLNEGTELDSHGT